MTRCVNYSKEKSLNFLHLYSMKTQHAIHDFFALFFHFYFVWYWYSISSFFIGWRRKMHLFYHFLTNKKNQSLRCSLLYCFFMSEDHFERRVLYRNFLHTYLVYIRLHYSKRFTIASYCVLDILFWDFFIKNIMLNNLSVVN